MPLKPYFDPILGALRTADSDTPGQGGEPPLVVATRFDFTQPTASATWTVSHNLGKKPNVAIYTVGGVEVEAAVVHLSSNVAQVLFDSPFSGSAVCLA